MPLYRIQITIPMASGNPKDAVQNVWHVIADDVTSAELAVVSLNTFYLAVDGLFSNLVAADRPTCKIYDLADPEPRAPVSEPQMSILAPGGNPLPPEVAFCVSFQAQRQSGQSQARRRGRVYLGPLAAAGVHTDGRPTSSFLSTVGSACQTLADDSEATAVWGLAVYSRVNQAAIEIDHIWIDNEWDTQRRRGRVATSRTVYT